MTRAHRSAGGSGGQDAGWAPAVRPTPRPVSDEHAATGDRDTTAAVGDVGSLTVSELAAVAELRRVEPSSLLSGSAQARKDLDLVARLPGPVAALVVDLARLDPATAAVVAGMIDRFAAADRRRRPPAR